MMYEYNPLAYTSACLRGFTHLCIYTPVCMSEGPARNQDTQRDMPGAFVTLLVPLAAFPQGVGPNPFFRATLE